MALRIIGNRLSSRPAWGADELAARLEDEERRLDQFTAGDLKIAHAFGMSYEQLPDSARRTFPGARSRRPPRVDGTAVGRAGLRAVPTAARLGVLINTYPGGIVRAGTRQVPCPNPDGTTDTDQYPEADHFRAAFAADLPVATTRLTQAPQRPFSAMCFTDPTTAAAWHTIPS
ncbi:hypothetical protein ACIOTI_22015 [Streptomyces sp. NPDC087843]|uniref:hypothetical protein n=1 Tax=Streptomyces sp. NPDC087843 TaxID=3365804 RepID=UPI003812A592